MTLNWVQAGDRQAARVWREQQGLVAGRVLPAGWRHHPR